MARAAVIPQSPPKRATRGRAKGSTTTKGAGKQTQKVTKPTTAVETKRRNARTVPPPAESESDEETEDEISVIEDKSARGKASGAKGKSTISNGRGRKSPAPAPGVIENESENENNDNELQSELPKKRAGRPKTKAVKEDGGAKAAPRPRGRPKGTSAKMHSEDVLKENTRKNRLLQEQDRLSSSQQGSREIYITTNSSLLRGPPKKKKVTFQEMMESESEAEMSEPAPTTRRRKGTVVAKDQDGLGAKPVRKAPGAGARGRKPAASKKGGAKPLSPKKATQVAKGISAYASSDGEDDELSGAKDAIKLVVHSPQKQTPGNGGLGSPVRRINLTPGKPSKKFDENGEPNLPPPKTFDFGDSEFMSSPARRPPPSSPFHFTLKETPRRSGLALRDSLKPLAKPDASPTQNSPLRMSPKKANLGTPGRASLFLRDGGATPQPHLNPAQDSPLKLSPKKGLFGASFGPQQPSEQPSTPFKSSLLMSPARKVVTPFKSSMTPRPSSLAKESRLQDSESDDETVSMYDESPLRGQNMGGPAELEAEEDEEDEHDHENSDIGQRAEYSEEDADPSDQESVEEADEEGSPNEDEMLELEVDELVEEDHSDQEADIILDEAKENYPENEIEAPGDTFASSSEDEDQVESQSTTPKGENEVGVKQDGVREADLEPEQENATDSQDELDFGEDTTPAPSTSRYSFFNGLEDVFTETSPAAESESGHNAMPDANDEGALSDDDSLDFGPSAHQVHKNEPTLIGEAHTDDLQNQGPIQPYEVEEVEHTPFVEFLLTHWVPTLPCVEIDESEDAIPPVVNTETIAPSTAFQEARTNVLDSPAVTSDSEHNTPSVEETPQQSVPGRGPRFTLLAEQLSQWEAGSPAKDEERRPRRGVFSLGGRRSGTPSAAPRAPKTDIFANAPSFPSKPRAQKETSPAQAVDIHEDKENVLADDDDQSGTATSPRQPMAEIIPRETAAPEGGLAGDDEIQAPADPNYPALELPADENQDENLHLRVPATPAKNPALPRHTYHTVSKVPLKPEGFISPLKINRKRGRSLSITSPLRSSPRLQSLVIPPTEQDVPGSPPRKSPNLQPGSLRKSQSRATLGVGTPRTHRSKTPTRVSSPIKSPQKQVPAYQHCLRGAVVYVDVHTTEGEDASGIFIELLSQMGARCIKNWSWNPRMSVSPKEAAASMESKVGITHVVFKDGGVRTLEKVRQAAGLVKCVGVGWVLDCEQEDKWLDEEPYAVDSSMIPRGGAKRRKSMEPRALSNVNGTLVKARMASTSANRRPSAAARTFSRSTTPPSNDEHSTPETSRKCEPAHTESDQRYWQTPRTPSAASLGYNLGSVGMSPATPFYLSQRSKLVQQTCPPKQTRQGLFSKVAADEEPSQRMKARLEATRRKSLAFKPAIGSPLVE